MLFRSPAPIMHPWHFRALQGCAPRHPRPPSTVHPRPPAAALLVLCSAYGCRGGTPLTFLLHARLASEGLLQEYRAIVAVRQRDGSWHAWNRDLMARQPAYPSVPRLRPSEILISLRTDCGAQCLETTPLVAGLLPRPPSQGEAAAPNACPSLAPPRACQRTIRRMSSMSNTGTCATLDQGVNRRPSHSLRVYWMWYWPGARLPPVQVTCPWRVTWGSLSDSLPFQLVSYRDAQQASAPQRGFPGRGLPSRNVSAMSDGVRRRSTTVDDCRRRGWGEEEGMGPAESNLLPRHDGL